MSGAFFDSNLILYLLSGEDEKADRAEALLLGGGHVSVQVLAEITSVCRRKFAMDWPQIDALRALVQRHCTVHPLTAAIHDQAYELAQRHGYTIYDSQIIVAALACGADVLWSEDMQAGQRFGLGLEIRNPLLG